MENDLNIYFVKENEMVTVNIQQPDLAKLINSIVSKNLSVVKGNLKIETGNKEFDKEEFEGILINAHEEFAEEINRFYDNIKNDINTYYDDDDLSETIITRIRNENNSIEIES